MRQCHTCGATKTTKGEPLKGNYCSPACLDRAQHRKFKGASFEGRVFPAGNSDDSYSMSNIHDPFSKLFDSYGGE